MLAQERQEVTSWFSWFKKNSEKKRSQTKKKRKKDGQWRQLPLLAGSFPAQRKSLYHIKSNRSLKRSPNLTFNLSHFQRNTHKGEKLLFFSSTKDSSPRPCTSKHFPPPTFSATILISQTPSKSALLSKAPRRYLRTYRKVGEIYLGRDMLRGM